MEYRSLGNSGLQVSVVGLGTNNFGRRCDYEQTSSVINRALELGITCIDTADVYGGNGMSEEFIGRALQGKRQDIVLATKFAARMGDGPYKVGASRRYVYNAVQDSLRRLQTDYIDLYQIHFPDAQTPIEETLRGLDDLVHSGMVRYIGCSNFTPVQVVEAHWVAKTEHLTRFISAQNRYNLLERDIEKELLPVCSRYGLGMLPFFPLASGFLTGKYRQGEAPPEGTRLAAGGGQADRTLTEGNFAILQKLDQFAQERSHSVLELAFAGLLAQPAVSSVIAGATKPEQLEANVKAGEWQLTPDDTTALQSLFSSNGKA